MRYANEVHEEAFAQIEKFYLVRSNNMILNYDVEQLLFPADYFRWRGYVVRYLRNIFSITETKSLGSILIVRHR